MSREIKDNLLRQIEDDLMNCQIPLKLIARSRDICELLVTDAADKRRTHAAVKEWSTPKIMVTTTKNSAQILRHALIS